MAWLANGASHAIGALFQTDQGAPRATGVITEERRPLPPPAASHAARGEHESAIHEGEMLEAVESRGPTGAAGAADRTQREVQQENNTLRETVASLNALVSQLRQDKSELQMQNSELEMQRDRLLAQLDAEQRKQTAASAAADQQPANSDDSGGISGLGLTFHRENPDWSPDGVVIKRVKPRGAAAASQKIQEGDTVLKIDGADVSSIQAEDLAQMCMGKRGSTSILHIRKRASREEVVVHVTRKVQTAAVAFLAKEVWLCYNGNVDIIEEFEMSVCHML